MKPSESLLRGRVAQEPSQSPSVELQALLARWELLAGLPGMQRERDRVVDSILDIYHDHPGQAESWFRAWKALHQTANTEAK